jgi:hypothetical protein
MFDFSSGVIAVWVQPMDALPVPCRTAPQNVLFLQTLPHERRTVGNACTAGVRCRLAG